MIKNTFVLDGEEYTAEYYDCDDFSDLQEENCTQVYGICFDASGLMVVGKGSKGGWVPVGGTIEDGESFEETLIREVKEESNMKVIEAVPLGFQKVSGPDDSEPIYQLRMHAWLSHTDRLLKIQMAVLLRLS